MSNRVEELESRVAELQAAVDGLTEELVETRERLRALEGADASGAADARGTDGRTADRAAPPDAEEEAAEAASGSGSGDADAAADADADAETEPESAEDSTNSDSDDIIVA